MSQMIARVAKAMFEDRQQAVWHVQPDWGGDFDTSPYRDTYLNQAKIAIAAMREPTEAMVDMGSIGTKHGARYVWQIMIDEALDRNSLIKGDVKFRGIVESDEALK